jgi:hypothetical protein
MLYLSIAQVGGAVGPDTVQGSVILPLWLFIAVIVFLAGVIGMLARTVYKDGRENTDAKLELLQRSADERREDTKAVLEGLNSSTTAITDLTRTVEALADAIGRQSAGGGGS